MMVHYAFLYFYLEFHEELFKWVKKNYATFLTREFY